MPAMIRLWEALSAPDATDGRNGGALRTVWEILLEMEKFKCQAGEKDHGTVALVLDLAKAFERVSLPVAWIWATHFGFPRKILRVLCGYFEHQKRVQFEGSGGAAPDHYGHSTRVEVELFAFPHCVTRRFE